MKHIKRFGNSAEFDSIRLNNYIEPWLSYTDGQGIDYNKPDYTKIPLTLEILGSGTVGFSLGSKTVQYSKNGGSWTAMDSNTAISVVSGDKIALKGNIVTDDGEHITSTAPFNATGNVISINQSDNFVDYLSVPTDGLRTLFLNCTTLISAKDLKLPATSLGAYCYSMMFSGCTNLIYSPDLPATTLNSFCYNRMFYNCTNLEIAPVLPALRLVSYCYCNMFTGCAKIDYIKCLAKDNMSASNCLSSWVDGVSTAGTFVKNPSASWSTGINGIPEGWTVQTATA